MTTSFDAWNKTLGGTSAPSTSTQKSFDDWGKTLSAPSDEEPGFFDKLGSGIIQGVHDVIDKPAEFIAGLADKAGITGGFLPSKAQTQQADQAQQQNFESKYGDSGVATVGRLGGQLTAALPVMASGEGMLTSGLDAAGNALGDTLAGNALTGASKLISGTAGQDSSGLSGLIKRGVSRVTQGALGGAAFNSLTGRNPLEGAEWGAAGVPVATAVGKVAGVVSKPIASGIKTIVTDLNPEWVASAATNKLTKALAADGITPQMVSDQMKVMGPQATPVDAASALLGAKSGGNFRNLAEVAANSPGPGQATANQLFSSRAESAPERVNQAIKDATGATGNIHAEASDLMAARSAAAKPLYEKALSGEIQADERLQSFLNDPVFQSGLAKGQKTSRLKALANNEAFNPADYLSMKSTPATEQPSLVLDANGNPASVTSVPGKAPMVSMKAADAAKKGLDDLLEQYRDPTTGMLVLDHEGSALNDVRNAYVDYLDQVNPDYAAARAAWAGPSQSLDALAMGRKALSNDAEITASNVARMSPNDREFFLSGVTRALQDAINKAQDGADVTRKIFGNTLIRNRIAAAFDNPEAFQQFENQMNNEAQFAATKNELLKNSASARRIAGQVDQGDILGSTLNAGNHLIAGNFKGAAAHAGNALTNFLLSPSERQLAEQSRLLFTQNPDEFSAAFAKKPSRIANFLTR